VRGRAAGRIVGRRTPGGAWRAVTGGWPAGSAALGAAAVLALMLPGAEAGTTLAGAPTGMDAYARLFVVSAAITGIIVTYLVAGVRAGAPSDGSRRTSGAGPGPVPGMLLFLGVAAVALGIRSPVAALLPGALAALAGLVAAGPATAGRGWAGREVLRTALAYVVAVAALELLVGLADVIAGEPFGVAAASFALALAVALRLGLAPLQAHAGQLDTLPSLGGTVVLRLWAPALFAVLVLAGAEAAVIPLGLPLNLERGLVAGLAGLSVVAGAVGVLTAEDLDRLVGYAILQDAGLALFAFAAPDAASWGAGRAWLLLLPAARSALLAWAWVMQRTFGTGRLADLAGWARRAPVLAAGLAISGFASVGAPGIAAFEIRQDLLRTALGDPYRTVVLIVSLASLVAAVRLLAIGVRRPGEPGGATQAADPAPRDAHRRPIPGAARPGAQMAVARVAAMARAPVPAVAVLVLATMAASLGAGLFGLRDAATADLPAPLPGSARSTTQGPTFQPVVPGGSPSPRPSGG
jgi:hypothetical protein